MASRQRKTRFRVWFQKDENCGKIQVHTNMTHRRYFARADAGSLRERRLLFVESRSAAEEAHERATTPVHAPKVTAENSAEQLYGDMRKELKRMGFWKSRGRDPTARPRPDRKSGRAGRFRPPSGKWRRSRSDLPPCGPHRKSSPFWRPADKLKSPAPPPALQTAPDRPGSQKSPRSR